MEYTFKDLSKETINKLETIRRDKQISLQKLYEEKSILCANIIALQEMIKHEQRGGDK